MSTAASLVIAEGTPVERREVSAGLTGMVLFLFSEAMLFAALISAFVVLSAGAPEWPPAGQPRLPVGMTGANTLILLWSGVTMSRAVREARRPSGRTARWIAATGALGAVFVVVQGLEWARLIGFGLSGQSSVYGATFYAVVGIHAAHVMAALVVLGVSLRRALRGAYTPARHEGLVLCSLFWIFVVVVWPVLYVLLYRPWV